MFRCFTDMNPHSVTHFSNQTSNIRSWSDSAADFKSNTEIICLIPNADYTYKFNRKRQIYIYKYFGVFDPETMPIADPE